MPADPAEPQRLDARGVKCPLPALWTERALGRMATGARLVVEADDPVSVIDIPHIVTRHGARLLAQSTSEDGTVFIFEIEKA